MENNLKYAKGKFKEYKSLDYTAIKSIEEDTINIEIELLQWREHLWTWRYNATLSKQRAKTKLFRLTSGYEVTCS